MVTSKVTRSSPQRQTVVVVSETTKDLPLPPTSIVEDDFVLVAYLFVVTQQDLIPLRVGE